MRLPPAGVDAPLQHEDTAGDADLHRALALSRADAAEADRAQQKEQQQIDEAIRLSLLPASALDPPVPASAPASIQPPTETADEAPESATPTVGSSSTAALAPGATRTRSKRARPPSPVPARALSPAPTRSPPHLPPTEPPPRKLPRLETAHELHVPPRPHAPPQRESRTQARASDALAVSLAPRWRDAALAVPSPGRAGSGVLGAGGVLGIGGGEAAARPRELTRGGRALDLLYFPGWLSGRTCTELKRYLLESVAWYQVSYVRPSTGVPIVTPRFTTAYVLPSAPGGVRPQMSVFTPLPPPLAQLLALTQRATGCTFNSILLNMYQTGEQRIGFHSDDEAYLGRDPAIASLTLGASRDFILRSKRPKHNASPDSRVSTTDRWPPLTLALGQGDLLLMRGRTQAEAEHAVPVRKAVATPRINLTFRLIKHPSGVSSMSPHVLLRRCTLLRVPSSTWQLIRHLPSAI